MPTPEPLVWYAAYGSNLSSARFMTYLAGGTAEGKTTSERGAADPTPPAASRPFRLRHALYFAGDAPDWGGGGVAFVRPEEAPGALTYARIYLVTVDQLRAVLAQENGLEPGRGAALVSSRQLTAARPGERIETGAGDYGLLLCVGRERGTPDGPDVPVWTFTSPHALDGELRAPSDAYLSTVCRGLVETFLDPAGPEEGAGHPGAPQERPTPETLERSLAERVPAGPDGAAAVERVRRLLVEARGRRDRLIRSGRPGG